jgi:hypothetical protein
MKIEIVAVEKAAVIPDGVPNISIVSTTPDTPNPLLITPQNDQRLSTVPEMSGRIETENSSTSLDNQ